MLTHLRIEAVIGTDSELPLLVLHAERLERMT